MSQRPAKHGAGMCYARQKPVLSRQSRSVWMMRKRKAYRERKRMTGHINETIAPERIVIVGASLAGLRAAEALRREGFVGQLTLIGDEPYPPYDRPHLSKQVLGGRLAIEHTTLALFQRLEAQWLLGVPAPPLDLAKRRGPPAPLRSVYFFFFLLSPRPPHPPPHPGPA